MSEGKLRHINPETWPLWSCAILAAAIPSAKKLVPGFIVLIAVFAVVHYLRSKRFSAPVQITPIILLFSIFALQCLGFIWSNHWDRAIDETGIKLSYFAFPVLAFLIPLQRRASGTLLKAFAFGALAFIPIALAYGIFRSLQHQDWSYLSYQELGINFHPTYAAAYQAFAYFILCSQAISGDYFLKNRKLHILVSILSLIFIGMLASKAGFIAGIISISMSFVLWFGKNKKFILTQSTVALIALTTSIALAPGSSQRVEDAVNDVQNTSTVSTNAEPANYARSSTDLRFVNWKAALVIISQHPMGVGTGDAESAMLDQYEKMGEFYAAEKKLNAHNQFLQAGVEHGWPGIILLISILFWLIIHAWRNKRWIMLNFVALCGMNFLFESFLEVQAGIVFFCYWIMVFSLTED